jgi:hypothetical protein
MKITIENKSSLQTLQLVYTVLERRSPSIRCNPALRCYNPVNINTILNAPNTICCKIPKECIVSEKDGFLNEAKWFATLKLLDSTSKEKSLELKITHKKNKENNTGNSYAQTDPVVIINALDDIKKKISITQDGEEIGFLTYPPAHNKHL